MTHNPLASPGAALALRPKDAARALGIGQRLLWSLTKNGEIPHLKVGTCVLYPTDGLRAWLSEQVEKARERPPGASA